MPKKFPLRFGDIIRHRRYELGLSQRELAVSAKVSTSVIGRTEILQYCPTSQDLIIRLATALDLDVNVLNEVARIESTTLSKLSKEYPLISNLLCTAIGFLTDGEEKRALYMFEQCLREHDTPLFPLAANFAKFIMGDLDLNEEPGNGIPPISHFFNPKEPKLFHYSIDIQVERNKMLEKYWSDWYNSLTKQKTESENDSSSTEN